MSEVANPNPEVHQAPDSRRALRFVRQAGAVLVAIAFWQWASRTQLNLVLFSYAHVPPPTEVLQQFWSLVSSPKLIHHVLASLMRVFGGFTIAAVLGVATGLAIGRSRVTEDLLLSPLEVLRPIPAVAWIPLAVLMFPSSEGSMIFITFIGALFPILLNTIHGVEHVDARLIASARSLGSTRIALFREIILPAAAPSIVTGLAIGMGTAWFCLVTAEMISGQFGIGYYTWESYTVQNYAAIVVGMLVIGALGMGSSALIRRAAALAMPWQNLQERKA
jgi:NitT/TauT family transport system permease protein